MKAAFCCVLLLALFSGPRSVALAAGTVTLMLTSPQDLRTVPEGSPIEWSILVSVSSGDSAGLAMILVDLVQSASNPEKFDIPPAIGVPPGMEMFSRPLGISNPGENSAASGYIGVQRGTPGQQDLRQIGGAQNTFGAPGNEMGSEIQVTVAVGQGAAVVLAQGTFLAPQTTGVYRFSLANALANTLDQIETPPQFSPVSSAEVNVSPGEILIQVGTPAQFRRGDCNGDGSYDIADPITLLGYLFQSGTSVNCEDACDGNDVEGLDISDSILMLTNLFSGGVPLPPPSGVCGEDPTQDSLGCQQFSECP
ncbi:MAG: hypothetical protein V3T77_06155 [Planctomycetota bacterium]